MSNEAAHSAPANTAPTVEQFIEFMTKNKMNITAQRRRIAEAFFNYPGHHTLEDFYQHMQKLDPSIGQTTVYRTLKLLCAAGLAAEIHFTDTVAHYEIVNAGSHHDHLTCVNCGKIVEIFDSSIEKLQKTIAQNYNFTLLGHYHVLYGLCADCREAQRGEDGELDPAEDKARLATQQK